MPEAKSALVERRIESCFRCGAAFACDAGAPAGSCWCAALPPLEVTPVAARGCLCPDCLRAALAAVGTTSGADRR